MKKTKFGKIGLWASMLLSLCAVAVGAFSTMAWFQVNQRPLTGTVTSGSPDFTIESVTGYKDMPQVDETGYKGTRGSNITVFTDQNEGASSIDLGTNDENFNVPTKGDGFYLVVKKGKEFKYTDASTKRFDKYESSNRLALRNVTFNSGSVVRVMKYTNESNSTVNEPLEFSSGNYAGATGIADGTDISIAGGTYNIWLDKDTPKVVFETVLDLANTNKKQPQGKAASFSNANGAELSAPNKNNLSPKKAFKQYSVTDGNKRINLLMSTSISTWIFNDSAVFGVKYSNANPTNFGSDSDIGTPASITGNTVTGLRNLPYQIDNDNKWFATISLGANWPTTNNYYQMTAGRKASNGTSFWNEGTTSANGQSGDWTSYFNTVYLTADPNNYNDKHVYAAKWGFYYKVAFHYVDKNGVRLADDYANLVPNSNFNPETPSAIAGYSFEGWYKDAAFTQKITAAFNLTGDQNVYARYVPVHTYHLICDKTTWSTPHIYAYNSDSDKNASWAGVRYDQDGSGTIAGKTYYTFTIDDKYANIIFTDGDSNHNVNTDGSQTVDITNASSHSGDYYVITGKDTTNTNLWTGYWYDDVQAVSATEKTYYVFDQTGSLGTPSIKASLVNSTNNSGTFYTSTQTTIAMSPTVSSDLFYGDHIFKVSVSETFTDFVIQNSGGTVYTAAQAGGLTGHASTSANSKYIFVISAVGAGTSTASWQTELNYVTYTIVYCLKNGNQYIPFDTSKKPNIVLARKPINGSSTTLEYTAGSSLSSYAGDYEDDGSSGNGIHYSFGFDSTLTWYTNEDLTGDTLSGDDSFNPSTYSELFVPAYCDISTLVTFYLDLSYWSNVTKTNITGLNGAHLLWTKNIAAHLFRITMPVNYEYKFNGYVGNVSYNNSWSNNRSVSVSDDGKVFYPSTRNDGGNNASAIAFTSSSIGTATIYIDGSATDKVMGMGDQSSNYFIYETGVRLDAGQTVSIGVEGGTYSGAKSKYGYDELDDLNNGVSARTYLEKASNNEIRIKVKGRYTFYINHSNQLAIAEVPLLGNGYYIMPFTSTVNGFSGAVKMMSTDSGATYGGFNVSTANSVYYIRSYVDAVDTPYSLVSHSFAENEVITYTTVKDQYNKDVAKITFKRTGKYTIAVNKKTKKVTISGFLSDDSFSLNRLLPSATSSTIDESYTSVVIEIGFSTTASHTQPMTMSLDFTNGANSYLGLAFYVGEDKLKDPYTDMRKKIYGDSPVLTLNHSASGTLTSSTALSTKGTYYAYIIIDYWTVTDPGAYVSGSVGNFVLRATQSAPEVS